jgi:hypothetical protein
LCCKNLSLFGRRAVVRRQAVWSHYGKVGFAPSPQGNSGMGVVLPEGDDVDAIPLDDILWEATRHGDQAVEFLKLDCEMAEWPILFAARRLALCRNIVGEYHCTDWQGRRLGLSDLSELLAAQGFELQARPYSDAHGLFWARLRH